MGLIDFVKDVGHKLGLDHGAQTAPPSSTPAQQTAQPQPAQAAQPGAAAQDQQKANMLLQRLKQLGFAGDDLSLRVDGTKATLTGKVASQEIKEKVVLVVGNSQGIASVDDQLQAPPVEVQAQATYYDVKAGDTLSKIAKQFYGDANRYPEIFDANRPLLKSADEIYPGQKLRIPAAQAVAQHA